ncbi:MAG TPA: UvrD-helicase domain-containing protein [Synergistales bacterium]|nr:UvrD-helicase domain-containing protein [Synergistales bacterium]
MKQADLILESLNPEQQEAVRFCDGPLLVLAGAGSGKTRVLSHKIAYLVRDKGVLPGGILAVTFTNKAAREMRDRVEQLVGTLAQQMQVSTFHAYGLNFLFRNRAFLEKAGYQKNLVVFDRNDSRNLVRDILDSLDLDPKQIEPSWVLDQISRAKSESDPKTLKPSAMEDFLVKIYELYHESLKQQGAVDFDDLLLLPLHILTVDRDALERERSMIDWVLVDEYQDVNRNQYLLLKQLVDHSGKIMVVGDPDQSIYGWRGADMTMILNFEHDFPKARVVVLSRNYRSTGNILNAANSLIMSNMKRKHKELWTVRDMGDKIYNLLSNDERQEAFTLAEEIKRLRMQGYRYGQIALPYRINAMSRVYEETFIRMNIPYKVIRGTSFYERKEIKDVISFMRLAVNPFDKASLVRIGNVPARGLGKRSLESLYSFISEFGVSSPREVWEGVHSVNGKLKGKAGQGASLLASHMLRILDQSENPMSIMYYILDNIGYEDLLKKDHPDQWEEKVENVRELLSLVPEGGNLGEVLAQVALFTDLETGGIDDMDSVNLLTLHAAKGLEFPIVFMVGLEEAIFPHFRCLEERDDLEEERRLCYVGMTRAEEKLYMAAARCRRLFGTFYRNGFSRFLWEIPEKFKVIDDRAREETVHAGVGSNRRRWGW